MALVQPALLCSVFQAEVAAAPPGVQKIVPPQAPQS